MRIIALIFAALSMAFARILDAQTGGVRNIDEYGDELAWMGGMDGRHGADEFEAFHSSEVTHVIR